MADRIYPLTVMIRCLCKSQNPTLYNSVSLPSATRILSFTDDQMSSIPPYPLYAGVFLISVNLTIKGLFSHVLNALNPLYSSFGFHNGAPSANSRSKFHSSAPKISLSSTYVRLRPMHPRGPVENGCAAFLISFPYRDLESAVSRKRSGMKASGFMKLDGECAAAQEATHTDI